MLAMKKSVVVFDCDGTLMSSMPLILRCISDAATKCGREDIKTLDDLRPYFGPDERGMLRNILKDAGKGDKAFSYYMEEYKMLHRELLPHPIDGIPELLRSLRDRRTLRLGLVTGRSKESTDYTLEVFNFARFFESIQTGSPKGINKPESMRKLMAELDVNHNEVIYVGDSPADIKSMQTVGVAIVSVCYDRLEDKAKLEKMNPGRVASSVEELKTLLLKNIR